MLTDEVSQVQEVRYCLKTLREQMAARHNNNNNDKMPSNDFKVDVHVSKTNGLVNGCSNSQDQEENENCIALSEVTKHLYTRLKEMERRHQEEIDRLQEENSDIQRRFLEKYDSHMQMETEVEEQKKKMDEMEMIINRLHRQNFSLEEKLSAKEAEMCVLKKTEHDRSEQLKKELKNMENRNHNLDDMLKSQQKKIRNMIQQIEKSQITMEQKNRQIRILTERESFLEAEIKELRDRLEYYFYSGPQTYNKDAGSKDTGSKVVYSKTLMPTNPGKKSLPFIKVVELKS